MKPSKGFSWSTRIATAAIILLIGLIAAATQLLKEVERLRAISPSTMDQDPVLRQQVLESMIRESKGLWDSSPDPDVGRLNIPGLQDVKVGSGLVSTNKYGMREVEYILPKPTHTFRIVLLGDSYVFAQAVATEQRFGSILRKLIIEHSPDQAARSIECLHLGVSGWNIRAETHFLYRQLGLLQPDLVVHLLIGNDLEDSFGIRGFGALSRFSDQRRGVVDGVLTTDPSWVEHGASLSWVKHGADWESVSRYEEAALGIKKLRQGIEKQGGQYFAWVFWAGQEPRARQFFAPVLQPEQLAFIRPSLFAEAEYSVSASDPHWNAAGHRLAGTALFGLLQARGYLDPLGTEPWEEADRISRSVHEPGDEASRGPLSTSEAAIQELSSEFQMQALRDSTARHNQVHCGIDKWGLASPYVSIILKNNGASSIEVIGEFLARVELQGASIQVFLDDRNIGTIQIGPAGTFTQRFDVPKELREKAYVSVRFLSNDWAYFLPSLRFCRSFQLETVKLGA